MICLGGMPAASSPSTTAATNAGRLPLLGPGGENTLMPMTSRRETRLCHASDTVAFSVRFVMARSTMARIVSGRGRKASVASGSLTTTTRACEPLVPDNKRSAVCASREPIASTAPQTIDLNQRGSCLELETWNVISAFLDTLGRECYHHL